MLFPVICFILLFVSSPAFCVPNLLQNPGFESGDGGWNGKQPGVGKSWEVICGGPHPEIYSLDFKVKHSGKCSQKMTCEGYNEKWVQEGAYCFHVDGDGKEIRHPLGLGLGNQAIAQTTKPGSIAPGKTYRLSAWVKIEGLTEKWEWFRLGIYWLDKDGKFIGETRQDEKTGSDDVGTHDWKQIQVDAAAPSNAAFAKVYLHHHFTHGTVWYDDIWFGEAAGMDIVFDFESGDLQGWQVMEGQFAELVSSREMCRNVQGVKLNKQGKYFLGTLEKSDGSYDDGLTGVIESPVFVLESREVSFLIGGGGHQDTYVALCTEDGDAVFTARGKFNEMFREVNWDASRLVGKKVFLQIVDWNTGGWGHINFDNFRAKGRIDQSATESLRQSYSARKAAQVERQKALAIKMEAQKAERMKELLSDKYLFERGKTKVYTGKYLDAISIPIGGIGAGCIQMNGRAERAVWQIFNNFKHCTVPNSFFAVRAQVKGKEPVVRALQTEPAGDFKAFRELEFRGEYPFAWYTFKDRSMPVKVRMEAFNPFIPLNAKDSAIPCAIFNITAENNGRETVDVSLLATQQNAVGYTGDGDIKENRHKEFGGNVNTLVPLQDALVLHMTAEIPEEAAGYGDMALAVLDKKAVGTAGWAGSKNLHDTFSRTGNVAGQRSAGPSAKGETIAGAVAALFKLGPGERKTVTFILTWYFPNGFHGQKPWGGVGNMYNNWWKNAMDTAVDVKKRLAELTGKTRLYHDSFYQSNLPHWLLDRITSQIAILRSRTCFWTKDGFFGGWEGCASGSGCCAGNCNHVWQYAQTHARLFPEIARKMREQEYAAQSESGAIPHRLFPGTEPAADGQYGSILSAYREHLTSLDGKWLKEHWPSIKRAMEYSIRVWDADEDGVLSGRQWNTLDEAVCGSTSWLGTLYLAALGACEKMAEVCGDADAVSRYRKIREAGMKTQNETLWNGEYYIQIPEANPLKDYNNGCHIDQVLGQWWADQLAIGQLYPQDRVKTALASLFKYNFHANFYGFQQKPRKFVDDGDSAMQMITWPKGGRPDPGHEIYYADEVMTGFEYAAAAAMVKAGLLKEGFAVVRAAYDRYDGRLRTELTEADTASWGYSGNPFGDDECGKFYARAMSVWGMLLTCQGFIYDGPAGVLGFKPVWKPEDHTSFFTCSEGFGVFSQRRKGVKQTELIEMKSGKVKIKTLLFETAPCTFPSQAALKLAETPLQSTFTTTGSSIRIELDPQITLKAGQTLEVVIE